MAKDKNGKDIKVGDFVKGRDGRSWRVKRIVGDELQFEMTTSGTFPASDYTVFNSALNAKFSEGQIVTVKKPLEDYFRKIPSGAKAKIVCVYGNGWYDIEVDGKVYGHSVSDAILALNAKFKVGDKVKLPDGKIGIIEKVVSFDGKTDNIIKVPGMSMTSRRDDELTLANSTNPVVANAVAWKARNAIKVGDIVISGGKHKKVVKIDPATGIGGGIANSPYYTLDDGTKTQHFFPVK